MHNKLLTAGYDRSAPALMLGDGVTPYLTPAAVVALLESLRSRASAGTVLAVDFALEPETEEQAQERARLEQRVAALNEPFTFVPHHNQLDSLFSTAGWRSTPLSTRQVFQTHESLRRVAFVTALPADV